MRPRLLVSLLVLALGTTARAEPLPGAEAPPAELATRLDEARAHSGPEPRTRHRDERGRPRFANRLALERSPYLLQHAFNPVNWFPWGDEAFAEARRLGHPVLLSIGYSTCHWCHVMEEESFEDLEIAAFLNRHYVAIKVDREERPDIDSIYMTAIQALTGRGGWPMTVWITPAGEPFYGGTYFPPRDNVRPGRPGLLTVLRRLREIYASDPERVASQARSVAEALREILAPAPSVGVPGAADIRRAVSDYQRQFDDEYGGLNGAQKFPGRLPITLLLRAQRRTGDRGVEHMATKTLDAMRTGGIYDHVGGGFHRYTVERTWTVPHFEKMLYDNALLTRAYVEGWQVTGDDHYRWVAQDVLDYVTREMTAPEGTFYSATDADSEGEEGRFFVWNPAQLRGAVGEELAGLALAVYGLDGPANFEGVHWVLRRDRTAEQLARERGLDVTMMRAALGQIRDRLRLARAERPRPLRDEKQLIAWNGLMIQAFARAGLAFRDKELVARGARAARALLERARPEGRLARYLVDGAPIGRGVLDDHAFLIAGLLELFEATGERPWLDAAISLQAEQDARFFDETAGGYWMTPDDGETLLARHKPASDGARPSGNGVAAQNLLRLHHLTSAVEYRVRAEMTLRAFSDVLQAHPSGYARLLEALDFMLDTPAEILIVTPGERDAAEPFLFELGRTYLPNRVLAVVPEREVASLVDAIPLLEEKRALGGRVTAYVCEDRVCQRPAQDPALFARQIRKPARPYRTDPEKAGVEPTGGP